MYTIPILGYRGTAEGPFFRLNNGSPLTKLGFMMKHIRKALQELGLPSQDFEGHSFCIGAATAAAKAGVEDSQILDIKMIIYTPLECNNQLAEAVVSGKGGWHGGPMYLQIHSKTDRH